MIFSMLYHILCLSCLGLVIKEGQPKGHSDMGVDTPQKCESQDRSQDKNLHSPGTFRGAERPS